MSSANQFRSNPPHQQ
jgi:hypothetical protein